jgi:hypothetical protein
MNTWIRRFWIFRRMIASRFFRILAGVNRTIQPSIKFCIKPGYHHAVRTIDYDDTSNKDEWQKEVYLLAASIAKEQGYSSVIDLGCGSAFKLIQYLGFCRTIGIETNKTYHWLQHRYPERNWLLYEDADPAQLQADLVICADVIEHMENPDTLMQFIQTIPAQRIILSTPERDKKKNSINFGPPENPYHYREWNADEFRKFVSGWFVIEDQCIFNDRSFTQVVICKKNNLV